MGDWKVARGKQGGECFSQQSFLFVCCAGIKPERQAMSTCHELSLFKNVASCSLYLRGRDWMGLTMKPTVQLLNQSSDSRDLLLNSLLLKGPVHCTATQLMHETPSLSSVTFLTLSHLHSTHAQVSGLSLDTRDNRDHPVEVYELPILTSTPLPQAESKCRKLVLFNRMSPVLSPELNHKMCLLIICRIDE